MRVYFDRRGRVRGYSLGWGGLLLQAMWWMILLPFILAIGMLLLAACLVCMLCLGVAALAHRPMAGERFRDAAAWSWDTVFRNR